MTGDDAGSRVCPKASQRSAVSASIDMPFSRPKAGEMAISAAVTAMMIATIALRRSVRPTCAAAGSARRLESQQAADDRHPAGLGAGIDLESELPCTNADPMEPAGHKLLSARREVGERNPRALLSGQRHGVMFTRLIDARDQRRGATRRLDDRGNAIHHHWVVLGRAETRARTLVRLLRREGDISRIAR